MGNPVNHRITEDDFDNFAGDLKKESDRAAVILGTSQLDLLLYQLIEGFLLPNTTGKDELLDGDAPLSTYSSRINLAYRLGLIDAEFSRALHLVRKIRNSFAHEVSGVKLESGAHRDRIRELVAPLVSNWAFKWVIEKSFDSSESAGAQFRAAVALMSLRLDGAISSVSRLKTNSGAYGLLPPDQKEDPTEDGAAKESDE